MVQSQDGFLGASGYCPEKHKRVPLIRGTPQTSLEYRSSGNGIPDERRKPRFSVSWEPLFALLLSSCVSFAPWLF